MESVYYVKARYAIPVQVVKDGKPRSKLLVRGSRVVSRDLSPQVKSLVAEGALFVRGATSEEASKIELVEFV